MNDAMATVQRHRRQINAALRGLSWYMSAYKWAVLKDFAVSVALIGAGIYVASLGFSIPATTAFGGAGLINVKFAKLAQYFATHERPPPQYQEEWAEDKETEDRQRYRR